MTHRFPAGLLALAVALTPVSTFALFVLSAPIFDFWWTPALRALVFLLMLDIVLILVGTPLLFWSFVRSASGARKPGAGKTGWGIRLAQIVCVTGILALAGAATYACTRPKCHQVMDRGDYYYSAGDGKRAGECWEEARRLCIEDGHDPAH